MKRRRRRKMFLALGALLCIVGLLMLYFNVPWSKTRSQFDAAAASLIAGAGPAEGVYGEADIAGLPAPVQKYFRACGFLGTPKMSYMKIEYRDVNFLFGREKPPLKIDYTQYDFVKKPDRIAYIDSSLYGLPFEGLDTYLDGTSTMKGMLAKRFPLFEQKGQIMDRSSLVTFLSEVLIMPNAALQDYIRWEAVDGLHAKAVISWRGVSAGGVFAFDEAGRMLSFVTDDRWAVAADGSSEAVRWSVVCGAYAETDGIQRPTLFQAIWHYDSGDLVYFDGRGTITEYR